MKINVFLKRFQHLLDIPVDVLNSRRTHWWQCDQLDNILEFLKRYQLKSISRIFERHKRRIYQENIELMTKKCKAKLYCLQQ